MNTIKKKNRLSNSLLLAFSAFSLFSFSFAQASHSGNLAVDDTLELVFETRLNKNKSVKWLSSADTGQMKLGTQSDALRACEDLNMRVPTANEIANIMNQYGAIGETKDPLSEAD